MHNRYDAQIMVLVTIKQILRTLVATIEVDPVSNRIVEIKQIRSSILL